MKRTGYLAILLLLPILMIGGCGDPPQLGSDREAFKTVDALYTALGLRDIKIVDQCDEKLRRLRDEGKLSRDAWSRMDSIITIAKQEKWESALGLLSQFMEGQRR